MLLAAGFDAAHVWLRPMRSIDSVSAAWSQRRREDEHAANGSSRRGRRDGRQRKADWRAEPDDGDDEPAVDGGDDEEEAEFKEWTGTVSFTAQERVRINMGWTAYIVGVVRPRSDHSSVPADAT